MHFVRQCAWAVCLAGAGWLVTPVSTAAQEVGQWAASLEAGIGRALYGDYDFRAGSSRSTVGVSLRGGALRALRPGLVMRLTADVFGTEGGVSEPSCAFMDPITGSPYGPCIAVSTAPGWLVGSSLGLMALPANGRLRLGVAVGTFYAPDVEATQDRWSLTTEGSIEARLLRRGRLAMHFGVRATHLYTALAGVRWLGGPTLAVAF